jgi:hypothetical protein
VLRAISEPQEEKETEGCTSSCFVPFTLWRWNPGCYGMGMRETRNAYRILVGESVGKIQNSGEIGVKDRTL